MQGMPYFSTYVAVLIQVILSCNGACMMSVEPWERIAEIACKAFLLLYLVTSGARDLFSNYPALLSPNGPEGMTKPFKSVVYLEHKWKVIRDAIPGVGMCVTLCV